MIKIKKLLVLLLVIALAVSWFPMGAFAADDGESGSSGSEIGSGSDGKGNAAGKGSSYMIAAGVTMQVVYYRYDQCYNRYNSHGSVVDTVQNHNAIPWNDTGKDIGETVTTVFDTFTLTPHTFLVKAMWHDYPYVYHFPNETLQEDLCTFDWLNFDDYWFDDEEQNPGGKPYTYSLIVRNEENGSLAIEKFLARIILGSRYGEWDKLDVAKGETVETDTSLFAAVLKYLGASDLAIQNYLDSYYGKLSVSQDGDTLIPTIIWSWVAAENLGRVSRIYTIGDVAANGTENAEWLNTAYTSGKNCNTGFKPCSWMEESTDTMICKLMLGGEHDYRHGTTIWTAADSSNLYGTGLVNRIQTEVDSTAENGTNTFYYLRGYWTPYGMGTGSVSLTKTNVEGTENLAGAEFTLYRDAACTVPVTEQDYSKLSTSDAGYVNAGVRSTDASGKCAWTGLYFGIYFLKETKAPEGYRVNTDSSGKVEVKTVSVKDGETGMTLTNAENTIPVTLQKSINAPDACIQQILGNPLYSLAGAEYTVSVNGTVVETLVTDENGKAVSNRPYNIGDVLTIRETKAPKGFKLDTSPYTHTVTADSNEISVTDIPIFDPPFVLTKVDKDTTTPQGGASFAGAVFKWEYFPNGDWSGSPARTWYFATDASGRCLYSQDYLAAGYTSDALYVSPSNVPQLPLGTVKITEVKSSPGYAVIPEPLYCSIVEDSSSASGAKHVWKTESLAYLTQIANGQWGVYEPTDTSQLGSVTVEKYDAVTGQTPQGEATLAGAKYHVINRSANAVTVNGTLYYPGEVVCALTTDASGSTQTGSILPMGTYEVVEASAPIGYLLNSQWSKTFTVTEQQKHHSFTYAEKTGCPETVVSGKIQIVKKIVNTLDNLNAAEAGAKFQVIDNKGNVVDTITTGANGVGISKDLPYGTYTVNQVSGQAGTVLCDPWTVTVNEHGKIYEYTKENPLWTASVSVHKKETGTNKPLVATFELCERTADGTVKVLEAGTTNADGNLVFSRKIVYMDGSCNKSTYFIRETEAPAGYVLDTREYPVSCAENNQVISVTVENSISRARLVIRKLSHKGVPMQGVGFELLKSLDGGTTWEPVGVLATDENGTVICNGLQVHTGSGIPVLYRVTEMSTQNGSTLMPEPLWQGDLTTSHNNEVVVEAVNAPTFELPHTGSIAGILLPLLGTVAMFGSSAITLLSVRRKEQ